MIFHLFACSFSGDFFERSSPLAVSPENQQARRIEALKAER
jgi:hypothetical protein